MKSGYIMYCIYLERTEQVATYCITVSLLQGVKEKETDALAEPAVKLKNSYEVSRFFIL